MSKVTLPRSKVPPTRHRERNRHLSPSRPSLFHPALLVIHRHQRRISCYSLGSVQSLLSLWPYWLWHPRRLCRSHQQPHSVHARQRSQHASHLACLFKPYPVLSFHNHQWLGPRWILFNYPQCCWAYLWTHTCTCGACYDGHRMGCRIHHGECSGSS